MPFAASLNTALRGKNLHRKRKRSSSPRKEWGDEESRGAKVKAIGARAPFTRRVPLKNMLQTVRSEKTSISMQRECDEVADETCS